MGLCYGCDAQATRKRTNWEETLKLSISLLLFFFILLFLFISFVPGIRPSLRSSKRPAAAAKKDQKSGGGIMSKPQKRRQSDMELDSEPGFPSSPSLDATSGSPLPQPVMAAANSSSPALGHFQFTGGALAASQQFVFNPGFPMTTTSSPPSQPQLQYHLQQQQQQQQGEEDSMQDQVMEVIFFFLHFLLQNSPLEFFFFLPA